MKTLYVLAALRFFYPFYHHPLDYLKTDPLRHWQNATAFWDPIFLSSLDSKGFQFSLWVVQTLTGESRFGIAVFFGCFCALFPLLWWNLAKYVMKEKYALAFALFLAVFPGFLTVYRVFMAETLILLAVPIYFISLFNLKKDFCNSNQWLVIVSGLYLLMLKLSCLPLVAIGFVFVSLNISRKIVFSFWLKASLAAAAVLVPAALHTHKNLSVYSPFRITGPSKINHYSGVRSYEMTVFGHGKYYFMSPSFDSNPLDPFVDYVSYRPFQKIIIQIDPTLGALDWDRVVRNLKRDYNWQRRIDDFFDNFVFLSFGASWPDATLLKDSNALIAFSYHSRWIWFPLILYTLTLLFWRRFSENQAFLIVSVNTVLLLMLFQKVGVMEGRYRKPIEPFLLLFVFFIFNNRKSEKLKSVLGWVHQQFKSIAQKFSIH